MNILVTGSNGQLGTELGKRLTLKYPGKVILTDKEELDLTDATAVKNFVTANDITHIINCAAYTAVDKAEEEKQLCTVVNVDAVKNLGLAAENIGAKIIHISTDYVFDGTAHRPYVETDKVNPVSHYGVTKRKGEMALLALCPDAIIIRTAWLYSPYGSNFVKTMLRLAEKNKVVRVVDDQIGTPTYAGDLADAIVAILAAPKWSPGIYHFTDEGVASWYDFAVAIFRLAGKDIKVEPISTEEYPTATVRPAYSVLNKNQIKKMFNIRIPHWEVSLAKCLAELSAPNNAH